MSDAYCRFYVGDALTVMRELPDASVDLVLTSPPFLALRSYLPADHPDKAKEMGSEPTPGAYIDALLTIVEECRRVLAPHGSLCLELGDTFAGSGGAGGDYNEGGLRDGQARFDGSNRRGRLANYSDARGNPDGMRDTTFSGANTRNGGGPGWPESKSLCLIPESLRWAMAYGRNPFTGRETPRWRVRNVVRWVRPNPPVGALGDKFRPATTEMVVACMSRDRWFDLDAVRVASQDTRPRNTNGPKNGQADGAEVLGHYDTRTTNPASAPPLDWWQIPTEPTAAGSVRRVRVPLDGLGDGIQRTVSPDCPVHVSPGRSGPSDERGERAAGESTRSERSGGRREPELSPGSVPTPLTPGQLASTGSPHDPAATSHSRPSHRTGHAQSTSSVDTPSAGSSDHIDDMSTSPESSGLRPGTGGSSTGEACPTAGELESERRTSDTSVPSSACTCSYWVEVDYPPQDTRDYATWPNDYWVLPTEGFPGAHYATWPRDLCVVPIQAMCPRRVCVVCGEPSRRLVGEASYQRTDSDRVPARLTMQDGERPAEGVNQFLRGDGANTSVIRNAPTLGWTDCGCWCSDCFLNRPNLVEPHTCDHKWRAGVVLDPFAGSGTTLAVAQGHGRSAIGIDLDPHNAELARNRIGMFLTMSGPVT